MPVNAGAVAGVNVELPRDDTGFARDGTASPCVARQALTRRREKIPAELFEALFWRVAGPIAAPRAPGMAWNGLLLCALDGFQVRVPDTPANRAYFGSSGTADNSSPFPMVRAVVVTAAGTRGALGLEFGPSSEGEQTLTRRLVKARPGVFGPGRLLLMDRNFPGFALIAQIRREGAHLLMRVKSDVNLPLEEALPDGSYRSFLTDGSSRIPVRVVEYDITVPGRDSDDEVYALATTLMDWQAYPASGLAGCYPNRWKAVETKIGEDKSAITDAGPSRGPILRSTTPHQVCQEMWAWMTSTQLVRMHACQAAQASPGPGVVHPYPPRGHPRDDPDARHDGRLRRGARRRRRARQPGDPGPAAARPAAPPPATAHQVPPAVPLRHRAGTRQHRRCSDHPLPGRADHLRRRPHPARYQPGPRRHLIAPTGQHPRPGRKTPQPGPWKPAPVLERHPGCHHAYPAHARPSEPVTKAQTATARKISPSTCRTPKGDGVGG